MIMRTLTRACDRGRRYTSCSYQTFTAAPGSKQGQLVDKLKAPAKPRDLPAAHVRYQRGAGATGTAPLEVRLKYA